MNRSYQDKCPLTNFKIAVFNKKANCDLHQLHRVAVTEHSKKTNSEISWQCHILKAVPKEQDASILPTSLLDKTIQVLWLSITGAVAWLVVSIKGSIIKA